MPQLSETEILQQLTNPESQRKAFEQIVLQYSEQLYWKIRGIVINHDDADDVLQNTFLKAWKNIDDFQGKSKLYTWLYRIAVNESLDFLRRQKVQTTVSADVDMGVANRLMADEYFDGDRSQALLQEAIAKLPDVQRTVFTLRYYDEMKYSEMSKLLETSEGALKASYHIAVQKITEYVKKNQ
jgi:RNA polymerase sigma-70 factor (ECF subfamily)